MLLMISFLARSVAPELWTFTILIVAVWVAARLKTRLRT